METVGPSDILIPYGAAQLSARTLSVTARDGDMVGVDCRVPHLIVGSESDRPLRLNNHPYEITTASGISGTNATDDPFERLRDHLQRYCDPWDKAGNALLGRYFEFVRETVEDDRVALDTALADFGSLFGYRDWVYSALRPLPRAHIPITAEPARYNWATFVPVDMAFWTGEQIVAVDIIREEPAAKSRLAARDALAAANVEVVDVTLDALARPAAEGLGALLPPPFHRFWAGEALPSGPFGPDLPAMPPRPD